MVLQLSYLIGTVIALGASTLLYFIPSGTLWMVYLAAVIIGIGGSLMLVTSLSIVADLIGNSTVSPLNTLKFVSIVYYSVFDDFTDVKV